jgi:hypothetical protein
VNDYELAIKYSKTLEQILKDRFGAKGKGLHECTSSVEAKLDAKTVKKLRYVATIRNKLVHDADYAKIDNKRQFKEAYFEALRALKPAKSKVIYWVLLLLVLAALYYVYITYFAK